MRPYPRIILKQLKEVPTIDWKIYGRAIILLFMLLLIVVPSRSGLPLIWEEKCLSAESRSGHVMNMNCIQVLRRALLRFGGVMIPIRMGVGMKVGSCWENVNNLNHLVMEKDRSEERRVGKECRGGQWRC